MPDSTESAFDKIDDARTAGRGRVARRRCRPPWMTASTGVADLPFAPRGVAVIGVGKSADVVRRPSARSTPPAPGPTYSTRPAEYGDLEHSPGRRRPAALAQRRVGRTGPTARPAEEALASSLPAITSAGSTLAAPRTPPSCTARSKKRARSHWPPAPAQCRCSRSATRSRSRCSNSRQFTADEFAKFHPAGSLAATCLRFRIDGRGASPHSGRRRTRRGARESPAPAERTGAIMLVDADGRLAGLFTDSDRAPLREPRGPASDAPVAHVMTHAPVDAWSRV